MGQVVTFYSYKGGTGRSMALANVGCLLARRGKHVLMVDWDLEAPGLHRYFAGHGRGVPERELDDLPGLIDLLVQAEDTLLREGRPGSEATLLQAMDVAGFVRPTVEPSLHLLKAGRFDDRYYSRVTSFDWRGLYQRFPSFMQLFAEHFARTYDFVLVDSRTGLTDISGICTSLLPDKLVVVFTPNRQSLLGGIEVARHAAEYRLRSDDLRPYVVLPVASRVDITELELRRQWRFGNEGSGLDGYQPLWERTIRELYDLETCDLGAYFDEVAIQYAPRYAYGEEIAVLLESPLDRLALAASYQKVADVIAADEAPWVVPESL